MSAPAFGFSLLASLNVCTTSETEGYVWQLTTSFVHDTSYPVPANPAVDCDPTAARTLLPAPSLACAQSRSLLCSPSRPLAKRVTPAWASSRSRSTTGRAGDVTGTPLSDSTDVGTTRSTTTCTTTFRALWVATIGCARRPRARLFAREDSDNAGWRKLLRLPRACRLTLTVRCICPST